MVARSLHFARVIRAKVAILREPVVAAGVSLLLATALQGCAGPLAAPAAQADPANPQARAPRAAYQPVTGGYVSQRPAEPLSWRERNQRVTPQKDQ